MADYAIGLAPFAKLFDALVNMTSQLARDCQRTEALVMWQANQNGVEEQYQQVQATYQLVLDYSMHVPPMDMAVYHTLTADMNALQQAMEEIEAHQEDQTEAFGRELASGTTVHVCLA